MRTLATILLLPFAAVAARVVVAPMEVSPFADTEVSTNVAINVDCERRREVALHFAVDGNAASNCIQVAFGRDADGNGVLDEGEEETLYGWRAGRYFAESFPDSNSNHLTHPLSFSSPSIIFIIWIACPSRC